MTWTAAGRIVVVGVRTLGGGARVQEEVQKKKKRRREEWNALPRDGGGIVRLSGRLRGCGEESARGVGVGDYDALSCKTRCPFVSGRRMRRHWYRRARLLRAASRKKARKRCARPERKVEIVARRGMCYERRATPHCKAIAGAAQASQVDCRLSGASRPGRCIFAQHSTAQLAHGSALDELP